MSLYFWGDGLNLLLIKASQFHTWKQNNLDRIKP